MLKLSVREMFCLPFRQYLNPESGQDDPQCGACQAPTYPEGKGDRCHIEARMSRFPVITSFQ